MTFCTLSIDLVAADDPDRTAFYDLLDQDGWHRANVSTTWSGKLDQPNTPSARSSLVKHLQGMASDTQVCLRGHIQIGDAAPISFEGGISELAAKMRAIIRHGERKTKLVEAVRGIGIVAARQAASRR